MKRTRCAFSFNLRVCTSKSGERCRNYNSFYMCLPLFKGPKVMGQANNHKSNFHFLILGCKSFAVNYSLKSGTQRHHQTLGFIQASTARPRLQLSSVPVCSWGIFPSVLSSASEMQIQVRWLTWPLHNIPLLCLKKLFSCFRSMLRVIVHLHCEVPSNEFWSIWLNMSR